MVVEGENPAVAAMGAGAPPTDVDRKVAEMIVKEIPNGACLQLGIGGMPNTVGSLIAESDLKDLGVHTEMYVDAFRGHCQGWQDHRPQQERGQRPSGLCLRRRHPEAV